MRQQTDVNQSPRDASINEMERELNELTNQPQIEEKKV
jgi:hypothetical protein